MPYTILCCIVLAYIAVLRCHAMGILRDIYGTSDPIEVDGLLLTETYLPITWQEHLYTIGHRIVHPLRVTNTGHVMVITLRDGYSIISQELLKYGVGEECEGTGLNTLLVPGNVTSVIPCNSCSQRDGSIELGCTNGYAISASACRYGTEYAVCVSKPTSCQGQYFNVYSRLRKNYSGNGAFGIGPLLEFVSDIGTFASSLVSYVFNIPRRVREWTGFLAYYVFKGDLIRDLNRSRWSERLFEFVVLPLKKLVVYLLGYFSKWLRFVFSQFTERWFLARLDSRRFPELIVISLFVWVFYGRTSVALSIMTLAILYALY